MKRQGTDVSPVIIAYEFALGLIELILGIGTAIFGNRFFEIYQSLRSSDFLSEQHDVTADFLEQAIPYLVQHQLYIVILLSALGIVKIVSSIGLWMKKEWGRHLLIWLLIVLIPFDLAGIFVHPSLLDAIYLFVDILIILYMTRFQPKKYLKEVVGIFR